MELDRQAIERRDFPISRRGYEPAAVDAHLRAVAAELEELRRRSAEGEAPLASSASSQVQGIIAAAERAAAEIERTAAQNANQVREAADRDAERARHEAIERSRAHVAAVSQAAAALLERVESIDGELRTLIDALHSAGGRLSGDLSAVERGMGELYDAAGGRGATALERPAPPRAEDGGDVPSQTGAGPIAATPGSDGSAGTDATGAPPEGDAEPAPAGRETASTAAPAAVPDQDLDGARLVALNMALNGSSRAETERFLAENYQLTDGARLVEEVFAAIET